MFFNKKEDANLSNHNIIEISCSATFTMMKTMLANAGPTLPAADRIRAERLCSILTTLQYAVRSAIVAKAPASRGVIKAARLVQGVSEIINSNEGLGFSDLGKILSIYQDTLATYLVHYNAEGNRDERMPWHY